MGASHALHGLAVALSQAEKHGKNKACMDNSGIL